MKRFCIYFLLVFSSCGGSFDEVAFSHYSKVENSLSDLQSVELEVGKGVFVKGENLQHRFNRDNLDFLLGDSVLYYIEGNVIKRVGLLSGEVKEIVLPDYELRGKISHFLPINEDSIITIQAMPPILMINDGEGNVFYKEKLPFFDFTVGNPWLKAQFMAYSATDPNFNLQLLRHIYFDSKRQQIHIPILPVDYNLIGGVEDSQTVGVFDLNSSTWERGYGKARGLLQLRGGKNFSGLFDRNYVLTKGDTSFISYPISHHVFAVDNRNDELIRELIASPQKVDIIPQPLDKEFLLNGDFESLGHWRNSSPFYDQLVYHEELNLFSRIYFHKKKPQFEKDGSFYWRNREITLLVFDEEFNLLSEKPLDPEVFELWRYIPTSKGYLVAELNLQRDLERMDEIRLGYTRFYDLVKER